eukprot:scaffold5296_cov215-Cylindrotheca_fusiformis.AAC.6
MRSKQALLNAFLVLEVLFVLSSSSSTEDDVWTVSWNAPFLSSASGYGSEATSFLVGLNHTLSPKKWKIGAGLAHGDSVDQSYLDSLPADLEALFRSAYRVQIQNQNPDKTIVICHSEPGAWSVPTPLYQSGWPCPPASASSIIGRTMFETDRLPAGWNERLNQMDEIWVPTHHHKQIFKDAGVTKPLVVVGQGIDVDFWNPSLQKPLSFKEIDRNDKCSKDDYRFLSVFKWEARKGPDVLLPSFYKAFPEGKGACLIIVTSLYHGDAKLVYDEVKAHWHHASSTKEQAGDVPQGVILLSGLSLELLVSLYRSVDSFVLPSRGEGWGRPYMEAMSMGLPVIATNWSGPTEFLNTENGYLLPIRGLVDAGLDSFPNHKWADPDPDELQRLMKHLVENPSEARAKGTQARQDIVSKWSNEELSRQVALHLERLSGREENIDGGYDGIKDEGEL